MKKFLALAFFLTAWTATPAQTLSTQTMAAHDAVSALASAGEQQISVLNAANGTLSSQVASLTSTNASQAQQISSLTQQGIELAAQNSQLASQLNTLQSTIAYRGQEWWPFALNSSKPVGGSGLGNATQYPADERSSWALLAVTPDAPIAPATANYFDCYYTHKFLPDAAKKFYRLEATWQFPTSADAGAANALEMEARQVLPGGNMLVPALQMRFRDHTLRYFDHGAPGDNWVASGITLPAIAAGQPVTVVLEAHRDDAGTRVFYDAVTINGVRKALTVTEAAYNDGWGPRLSDSLQLDANTKAFKVNVKDVRLTVN